MSSHTIRLSAVCLAMLVVCCKPADSGGFNPAGLAGPQLSPPLAKPHAVFTSTEGMPFDLQKETEGYVTLLFFGYTHCPDVCPVHLANIAAALGKLSPEVNNAVKVVFVTTDPARDTPQVMRTWLDRFDRRFIGLTGDTATIADAMRQLKLGQTVREPGPTDSTYTVGHAAIVLAFTRDNFAHVVYPFGIRQADWARDLVLLTREN